MENSRVFVSFLLTLIVVLGSVKCAMSHTPDSYSIELEESTKFINSQAKEIERKLVLPKGFPRELIKEEIYLYFEVAKDGEASDFRPLKYDKQSGLTQSQYDNLLTAMATAVKNVNIKIPRDPVGAPPYWLVLKISAVTATMNVVIEAPPKRRMPKVYSSSKSPKTQK